MRRFAVIGHPVGQTLSPVIHNAAFESLGMQGECEFVKEDVIPGNLASFIAGVRRGDCTGVAVTMPHKAAVIPLLDSVSGEAKMAGAVNTVVCIRGELAGHNTDGEGCAEALASSGVHLSGATVAMLGAGGAARAAAIGLARKEARKVTFVNRTAVHPADFVRRWQFPETEVAACGMDAVGEALAGADILVNATPVGMAGFPEGPLVPEDFITEKMAVMDMVSNPAETRLIAIARKVGAVAVPGTEMLLRQGALQFKLFTGREAPIEAMREALDAATGARSCEGAGRSGP